MMKVKGRCPACGHADSMFVANGGYITCSIDTCKNPALASDLLELGRTLHDLARSGAQVHHIDSLRDELRGLLQEEPFRASFAAFLDRLLVGRDPFSPTS